MVIGGAEPGEVQGGAGTAGSVSAVEPETFPPEPAPRDRRLGGQAAWTILDQMLSSVANFGLTILVARALDRQQAGAFAYAFLLFTFTLGLSRSLSTDPLIIRFSASSESERTRAIAAAAGTTLSFGLLVGSGFAVAGLVLGGELGTALLLLLVVLPGQFLQDCWRNAAFASGKPREAAKNDAVRAAVQFTALGACAWWHADVLGWYFGAWALGAWTPALMGTRQFAVPRGPAGCLRWLRDNRGLSLRLGGNFALNSGAVTVATSLFAALLGVAVTGGLRFAQSILGPIQVLFGALDAFFVPMFVRRNAAAGPTALRRPSIAVAGATAAVTGLVVAVLVGLPDSLGRELLGQSWAGAHAVMLPVGIGQCAVALALGGAFPLMAMGRADLLLRVTAVQAPLLLMLGLGGALKFGIVGAAWGMAIAQMLGAALSVALARRSMRASTPAG